MCAKVEEGNFLFASPDPSFDAVVGNPPYVRFQSIDKAHREAIAAIAADKGVTLSALSSLWVPFVLHGTSFLKKGGRLGFVLPAELLSVNYAAPVRSFLMDSFASVQLVTFDEPVFPEVQEEVVLLLADGWQTGKTDAIAWRQCRGLEDLPSAEVSRYEPGAAGSRWSGLFASGASSRALEALRASGDFPSLSEWGRIALGTVTGCNRFFVLSTSEVEAWGLEKTDVVPLCPPGSKHLRRVAYTAADARKASEAGAGAFLFHPAADPSSAARRYIAHGEAEGVNDAYKCRVRSPWWRVPLGEVPDAFVTYMNAYGPNICANEAGVSVLNSCHGLYYHDGIEADVRELLPIACLNSATMLGAEMVGRAYGGGILKLEPREATQLPVPSPALVARCAPELRAVHPYVEQLLEKRDFDGAIALVDAVFAAAAGGETAWAQMKSSATLMRLRRKKRSQVKRVK